YQIGGKDMTSDFERATFAGGCFWCMVEPFDERPGIINIVSGYTGGHLENPTYEQVCSDTTGHLEAVQITFDPHIMSYQELVEIFWQQIGPTDPHGQFNDRGESYKIAVFYRTEERNESTEQSKHRRDARGKLSKSIVTTIRTFITFDKSTEIT